MYVVQQHVSTDPSLTGSVGISVGWRTPGVSGRSAPVPLFRKNPGIHVERLIGEARNRYTILQSTIGIQMCEAEHPEGLTPLDKIVCAVH